MPSINGGYLIMTLDEKELHITSVPSMILGANQHRDNIAKNFDHFEDTQGNIFDISVYYIK